MTDLPQLRSDLVAAGVRRRRRAHARSGLLAAATLALAVAGLTRIEVPPEREVPAAPRSDGARVKEAFGVFRRPATKADRFPGVPYAAPGRERAEVVRSRLVARVAGRRYYLVHTTQGLCLLIADGSGGCGDLDGYLSGTRLHGTHSDGQGPSDLVYAVPDGVRDVAVTTIAGEVRDLEVVDNAVATRLPARPSELRWTTPDGTRRRIGLGMAPVVRPAGYYSVLTAGGEQLVGEDGGAQASLADREGRVCLRVQAPAGELEGCRDKPADVRRALIVVVGAGDGRALAAAFTDAAGDVRLRMADGSERRMPVRRNAVLVGDASAVVAIRYRSAAGRVVTDRVPASGRSAVLNGEPRG